MAGGRGKRASFAQRVAEWRRRHEDESERLAEDALRARGVDVDFRRAENRRVVEALREARINVRSVFDLVNTSAPYPKAIPVLMRVFPTVEELVIKDGVIRALTTRDAGGIADGFLIAEFRKIGPADGDRALSLKWTIGNALSVATDMTRPEIAEAIYDLAREPAHGHARPPLVPACSS